MGYECIVEGIVSFLGFVFLYNRIINKTKASSSVFGEENCVELIGNGEVDSASTTDIIIVGAALACTLGKFPTSLDGRRVRVIERDLNEPDRIVGELLQPMGYLKLIELDLEDCVEKIDAQQVFGYALFKNGKSTKLSYPLENFRSDVAGRSFHNGWFIQRMRHKAATLPNVSLEQGSVTSLLEEKGTVKGVQYKTKDGQELAAYAPLTIVCNGGFSNMRRALCGPKNCELPHANHGHVILADPSPISFYPISSTEVRCLVDVNGPLLKNYSGSSDVERFIVYISVSSDDVTLYVVEPRNSIVGSVAGSNKLSFSQNPQHFSNPNPNQLSAPNSGFRIDQLDDDEPTEKIVNPACNDFDIGQYPNFDDETAVAEEDVVDDNEEEVTTVNEHVEHPFCNSYNPEEEKVPEEKKMPREYNWNMPELLQIPEEELVKKAVDCYTKVICIKKDDCFDTKEDLKIALYTKCVEDGYQLKVNKSSKDRFETRCMIDKNCTWRMIAKRIKDCEMFQVRTFIDKQTCSRTQVFPHHRQANKKVLGGFLAELMFLNGKIEMDALSCCFIAIGAAIRSFITCMHPVIIVDGAHLKGRYLGVNLLAVAMDANNGILPIAYGVGKSETSDSWTWFMGHLRDCIGPISNLTIISDRANSIDNAVRRCFPDAFHGLCGVHLYRNLKKCAQTLEDVGFERWSRVHQLGARYGFMTSNSAESINALSRHSRKLPITMLMEFFRASIQQWYYKKRNHAVLDNNLNGLVDLNARTCSCMKWQTSGYPCGHVIKVALHLNQDDSSTYAMDCYTTEVYRQTYAEIVYPIPHPSEWDIPDDLQTVLPPAMDRRLPGRPKSHDRIPSKGEEKKRSTCSRCKESGHTRLTCGSLVPSQSSFPLPKYGSSSKSKAHMVSNKRQSKSQSSSKSQSQPASPLGPLT
ncbi:Squalene epoxidase 3 [Hibiscus syriacus]|uniref:squalene monooxygenase n=1 Tax=Hibiscus syriacus TaxID=106335 RepID=A0A6A2XCF8_HIBSY|nr:Squalene epoxidase 3 [Hibiscus syriacus]